MKHDISKYSKSEKEKRKEKKQRYKVVPNPKIMIRTNITKVPSNRSADKNEWKLH